MIKPLRSTSNKPAPQGVSNRVPMHRRPLAQWIAAALAMSAMHAHAGGPPLSQSWLASQRGAAAGNPQAAGTPGSAGIPGLSPLTATQAQQQQSVQQALQNLNRAAQAVATQISNQQAAQQAAQALAGTPVPDGIAAGGLQVAAGIASNPALWQNANAPTQSVSGGQTNVEVKQTAQKAILTWDSFNVGRHTTLHFDQTGGTQTDGSNNWIALNRITDPSGRPSQILGQIKAEGSVYLINRNGIVFGAGSQVNTHSLLATSMNLFSNNDTASNTFFLQNGISQTQDPNHVLDPKQTIVPLLIGGATQDGSGKLALSGDITVEKGASIQTQAQGFTLIAAPHIVQAGSITADDGTAILASADALQYVAPQAGSGAAFSVARSPLGLGTLTGWSGSVENDGIIQTRRGNIQLYGSTVAQNGVLVASTSLNKAGQISLGAGSDFIGIATSVELGEGSVTTVLPEKDGETTTSSQDADQAFQTSSINLSANSSITLDRNALVEAPSGNVSMNAIRGVVGQAATRIYLDQSAVIDVSGLSDVELPMAALLVSIPRIGQNELADSPLLRNSFLYTQKNILIDSTQSGVRADGLDWVGSPVLNAAGYVENIPRTIDQLMLKGGTINLVADEVIARSGSQLRADGGYLSYLPGWIQTPNLLSADGRIYNIADADPNIQYVGFAGQYADDHARWGVTDTYTNPLLSGLPRYDDGFIQGANAGAINIGGQTSSGISVEGIAILDGDLSARAYAGRNQVAQATAPLGGSLSISSGDPLNSPGNSYPVNYRLVDSAATIESTNPAFDAQTPLGDPEAPGAPQTAWYLLPTDLLDRGGFSRFKLATVGDIEDDANRLSVHPGGEIDLLGTGITVAAGSTIQASAGAINLTGINALGVGGQTLPTDGIAIGAGATLDARGLWVNDSGLTEDNLVGKQYINGGSIDLSTTLGPAYAENISLAAGSVLDVSSGGYVQQNGLVAVDNDMPLGQGGDITLATHVSVPSLTQTPNDLSGGRISIGGSLLGYGFAGGGTLSISAPQIQIGGEQPSSDPRVALLYLPASFFSGQGFADYQFTAAGNATIADNTSVIVKPANLLPDYAALAAAPTGSDIYANNLTTVGYLDDYHRWLEGAGSGHTAGFSLQAGQAAAWFPQNLGTAPSYVLNDTLVLGQGATVQVDPGAAVNLQATGNLNVFGDIVAHGGDIDLASSAPTGSFLAPNRNLWLGPDSLIDASGISLINPIAAVTGTLAGGFVPRTGEVLDGGQVSLSADKYLLAQSGALIDVSGASDTYDLPSAQTVLGASVPGVTATPVWSNAGSIDLAAAGGMLFDASYDAHAGAAQGRGGSLAVRALVDTSTLNPPVAIVLQQGGNLLPDGYQPGDAIAPADTPTGLGILHFAVDRLDGTGITDFSIGPDVGDTSSESRYVPVPILFAGNVSLNMARSVVFNTTALVAGNDTIGIPPASGSQMTGAGTVSISAPYVYLANSSAVTAPLAVAGDGSLDVQGQFIDIGGRLSLAGFTNTGFHSQGDLRFYLPASDAFDGQGAAINGWLYSSGNMDFSATRIYPVSDYSFLLDAAPQQAGQTTTIRFENSGNVDNSTPLSAGGTLTVAASQIEQGGTLWLPSGNIVLGVGDAAAERTALGLSGSFAMPTADNVDLLPGSTTSVSLNGSVLPYGSTVDGQEWRYDAAPNVTGVDLTAPPAKQISINGNQVSLQQGATVDVSGGGDLQAFEWIPGTGGSRDVLLQSQVSYATSTTGTQQSLYPDNRAVYAVIPGYTAPVAAQDFALEKGAGAGPAVGQAVYLSGVPGLPAGIYTLLPARYATLKGAFRVVQDTGSQDAVLGRNTSQPDGTQVVSGYFVDALTGAHDARTTTFDVQSMAVWQQYSQYTETSASQFFANQAEHAGNVAPPLPQDAGHLILAASQQLELGATLTAATGTGGRGAEVDIAGQSIQILGSGEQARAGYLTIDADGLSTLGASSLLIGGTRSAGDDGDVLDVQADSIVLSNDAAHPLSAPEVILAANGTGTGIEVDTGSVLSGAGDTTGLNDTPLVIGQLASGTTPAISGDGALLRVSSGPSGSIVRHDVTGIDGAAGTAKGDLTIADGVTINGGNALSIDATGKTQVDAGALLGASNIDVTANRIAFVGDAAQSNETGFLVGDATLRQFDQAQNVTLRSRGTLDFVGDVDVTLDHNLELDASALTSDGGMVDIHTAKLTLTNDIGGTSAFANGNGQLGIQTGELDLGDGAWTLRGFGGVAVAASQGVVAQGDGVFDFGQLDLNLQTPRVIAATGANTTVQTGGALSLTTLAGTALSMPATGGILSLSGGSVSLDTDIEALAGKLDVNASAGDIVVGSQANLNVAGVSKGFNDVQSYLSGGTLILNAANNVQVDNQATLDIAANPQGGNGGQLNITAGGQANLGGHLLGSAAAGYLGGNLDLNTNGAVDLDALSTVLTSSGINGSLTIRSGAGDLDLSADHSLVAHLITLTADGDPASGGWARIDGTLDASGTFGGPITLYGKGGVDVEGALLTFATAAGGQGGNIQIGTDGQASAGYNTSYGYENVLPGDSGSIIIGSHAVLKMGGDGGNGSLLLRAPLLTTGDVNVTINDGAQLVDADQVVLEAYATWSTDDQPPSNAQHFDGIVDPAGWYNVDPATGQAVLVAGTFTDDSGNSVAAPDPSNAAQMADYMAKYVFTPNAGAASTDHQSFYGYVDGDPSKGAGTLMGFVENAGVDVGSRFAAIPNFHIRPGINLINPDTNINQGDISILTNWNLGAGTQNADGSLNLAYRYGDQAPILNFRAESNLDIHASITDGFFQSANFVAGAAPVGSTYDAALTEWNNLISVLAGAVGDSPDTVLNDVPGVIFAPKDFMGVGDPKAIGQYYEQYVLYAKYQETGIDEFQGTPPVLFAAALQFGTGVDPVVGGDHPTPDPLPLPTNLNQYPAYFSNYQKYLISAEESVNFDPIDLQVPTNFQTMAAPPQTGDEIVPAAAPLDNSPSPLRAAGNPLPLLSATLSGGNSSSYRLVAGANFASADPLAVQAVNLLQGASAAQITLDGHTDYVDTDSGRVIYSPTLVRTGNGDIDMAAAGDIRWLDEQAPAAIYTGGVPSGAPAKASVQTWLSPTGSEWLVNNLVNPIDAGNISLTAGGDIVGIQQVVDTDGSITGHMGESVAQYWWPWMQTGNTANSSSINFSAFDQGIMSVGGNVNVTAGGDIRQLSVSLPTTWTISSNADGSSTVNTIGSGNLSVNAGGDILSGDYFVAHGTGNIHASGSIGADFSQVLVGSGNSPVPVSTLFALQDAQLTVSAGGSVDIGGVYNPSWLDMVSDPSTTALNNALSTGHFDGQSYGANSSLSVLAAGGDLGFGTLTNSMRLLVPVAGDTSGIVSQLVAGFVLPANLNLTAANGSLSLLSPGELYPSATGNLTLMAQDSVHFDNQQEQTQLSWGLIDAPASFLPSPLNTAPLQPDDPATASLIRDADKFGYLYNKLTFEELLPVLHQAVPLHGADQEPVRIYALNGDIVDGQGGALNSFYLVPNKPARIMAGQDIVDLVYLGQQTHASDVSLISAGRDIYDTSLTLNAKLSTSDFIPAAIVQGGPGTLQVQAGRDIGPLTNEQEVVQSGIDTGNFNFVVDGHVQTGIDSVGNAFNPYLPSEGASVQVLYGIGPGIDQAAFIAQYVNPSAGVVGVPSLTPDLVSFMDQYVAGLSVDTGLLKDKLSVNLTPEQAWEQFQQLPSNIQLIFVQKALFKVLAEVGSDYNDPSSPFQGQYARGYAALSTLFPASLGYTDNGSGAGGINGAQKTVDTGDLDVRNTTIQTQQGGDIDILGPGGQALLGSTSSPPVIVDRFGNTVAGPNDLGLLTLRQGDINIFTDRSVLLAQSRIFTEQGGDIVAWSSNGDINAGKGAKTTSEVPPLILLCDIDAFCKPAPLGEVSGAGIATLQSVVGAPTGNAFLMAPRGTVDAGDAGIRVSGNLVVAAAQVANADNIQVQGEKIGVPVAQSVNVGALSAASAAASAVTHVVEDMANKQRDDARNQQPSVISVHVLGAGGDASSSLQGSGGTGSYDQDSPVQVLGAGRLTSAKRRVLTTEEQSRLSE